MFKLKRITTEPDSPIRILASQDQGDGDAGLTMGGSFFFEPAGQDGDTAQVSERVARDIMGDPALAVHFECHPALPGTEPDSGQPDQADGPVAGGKGKGRG